MDRDEKGPLRSFQQEADEHLFRDVHMDERLKQKVRQSVLAQRQERRDKRWKILVGTAVAAVILGITIVSTLDDSDSDQILLGSEWSAQDPGIATEILATEADASTLSSTLMQGEETEPTDGDVSFGDLDEAESWFGESILFPAEVPAGFELIGVTGTSDGEQRPYSLSLHYAAGEEQFTFSVFSQHAPLFLGGQEVDINGISGYWGATNHSDLLWTLEGRNYRLLGDLSREQAMNVVASLQD